MTNFNKITLVIGMMLTSTACLVGQSTDPKLDRFFEKKMKKSGRIGMQVAYISNGELSWEGSYGIKTFETNDRINDSTVFMVASISKPVTALAVMKLYDEGKLSLDDNVNDYLPFHIANPNYPNDIITIRMLLTHVSSIRDNWEMLEIGYTIDDGGDSPMGLDIYVASYLLKGGEYYDSARNFYQTPPKTMGRYSNVGYSLAALIVQNVSGMPFNVYMKNNVFTPLGMDNTFWFLAEIPHTNLATPHNMPYIETDFKGTQILNHFGYPGYPSGQLRTTVSDYAQIVNLMLNKGKVGNKQYMRVETIDEMLAVQYTEIDKYQAISWSYNEFESFIYYMLMPRLPSHTGLDPGMSTVVSFDPKRKTGAIIFTNSPTTTFKTEKIIYLDMTRKLLKKGKQNTKK
jgi:CubicO group peptidase (beta-lactamase class C family)